MLAYTLGWQVLRQPAGSDWTAAAPATVTSAEHPALALAPVAVTVAPDGGAAGVATAGCPTSGLPLVFLVSATVAVLVSPRFDVLKTLHAATDEALPVLGILCGVGAFIQVMTLTGARGWLVAQMLGAPSWALVAAAAVSMPLFGAISAFGSASVLGVPVPAGAARPQRGRDDGGAVAARRRWAT